MVPVAVIKVPLAVMRFGVARAAAAACRGRETQEMVEIPYGAVPVAVVTLRGPVRQGQAASLRSAATAAGLAFLATFRAAAAAETRSARLVA